jgi:hypothetical protein
VTNADPNPLVLDVNLVQQLQAIFFPHARQQADRLYPAGTTHARFVHYTSAESALGQDMAHDGRHRGSAPTSTARLLRRVVADGTDSSWLYGMIPSNGTNHDQERGDHHAGIDRRG